MKRKYYYVVCMGMMLKLTPAKWKKYLKDFTNGKDPDLYDYGTIVAGEFINVTDMDREWAQDLLKELIIHP